MLEVILGVIALLAWFTMVGYYLVGRSNRLEGAGLWTSAAL